MDEEGDCLRLGHDDEVIRREEGVEGLGNELGVALALRRDDDARLDAGEGLDP